MAKKIEKQLIQRKKFIEVEIPLLNSKIELIGSSPKEIENRTIKLDMTRQLKGKSVELVLKVKTENSKPIALPKKITLMSYFIRRMIRKRISYVEDSFSAPSQESLLTIKPFLITKRRVSRAVRKTLRNKAQNWIKDYVAERKNETIFSEILSNKLQKTLSLFLKKTYPLSLCEIRILEVKRELSPNEIPKAKTEVKEEIEEKTETKDLIEKEIKQAEREIKKTQEKAIKIEESQKTDKTNEEKPKSKTRNKKTKKQKSEV